MTAILRQATYENALAWHETTNGAPTEPTSWSLEAPLRKSTTFTLRLWFLTSTAIVSDLIAAQTANPGIDAWQMRLEAGAPAVCSTLRAVM